MALPFLVKAAIATGAVAATGKALKKGLPRIKEAGRSFFQRIEEADRKSLEAKTKRVKKQRDFIRQRKIDDIKAGYRDVRF